MNNFWKNLRKPGLLRDMPFFALAPMADVTDAAFRQIIAKYGKPNVMWTEFVSADGLCRANEEGKKKLLKDLEYSEIERPIVAQIFSGRPEYIEGAAKIVLDLGFDGLDINMGCPDKTIEKQCAGAALIKNPKLAKEIIQAAKRGVENKIPISVKTRVGFNKLEIEEWIPALLEENIAALTIHARTRKEMSKVLANWNYIKRAVEIRNDMKVDTLIIGNGDVKNIEEGIKRAEETGCDGVMIGRGIFGNPWLFEGMSFGEDRKPRLAADARSPSADGRTYSTKDIPVEQKLKVMVEHTKIFEEKLTGYKNFAIMKKHFKAYVDGFEGAKDLRIKLMETDNASQVEAVADDFIFGSKAT